MLSVCCVTNLRKQFHDSCKITTAKTNSGCWLQRLPCHIF
jgi:hypothetical protein